MLLSMTKTNGTKRGKEDCAATIFQVENATNICLKKSKYLHYTFGKA